MKYLAGSFETFLDPPLKVIKALARQFPNNTFTLRYYDTNEGCEGCLKLEGERVIEESRIEHHRWWKENRVVIAKVDLKTYCGR